MIPMRSHPLTTQMQQTAASTAGVAIDYYLLLFILWFRTSNPHITHLSSRPPSTYDSPRLFVRIFRQGARH